LEPEPVHPVVLSLCPALEIGEIQPADLREPIGRNLERPPQCHLALNAQTQGLERLKPSEVAALGIVQLQLDLAQLLRQPCGCPPDSTLLASYIPEQLPQ